VALNKIDALDEETREAKRAELAEVCGRRPYLVSGVSGEGVTTVLRALMGKIRPSADELAEAGEVAPAAEPWRP
jgi:GTPase